MTPLATRPTVPPLDNPTGWRPGAEILPMGEETVVRQHL